jgi:NAD(P)-dependent dehydrogenase (short-subunit alcohol dehydrogenase family)
MARNADSVNALAKEINDDGGDAIPLPVPSYTPEAITTAFGSLKSHPVKSTLPTGTKYQLRGALFNAGFGVWKPFLSLTPENVREAVDTNIIAAFAFAREALLLFKENDIAIAGDESSKVRGKRGFLFFTGATASLRGNTSTSAFAAGKFGVRALSQSLAKEFGKENIHVAHLIIDGGIMTTQSLARRGDPAWEQNADARLTPEGVAQAYFYLANQERSTWTWELDLRPAHEKW